MTQNLNPSAELRARVALQKHSFHNSHALGQNFILDEGLLNHLLGLAEVAPNDRVLEIGPGAGVMTVLLAARCSHVLAVEVDRGLEPVLGDVLGGVKNAEVVFQDIMKADLSALMGEKPYRVVANLPYYITADILLKLTTTSCAPDSIAIMVQREAADRLMSHPGSKSWCALAATVQSYGTAEVLDDVPPDVFNPPPHVQSQFILIRRHAAPVVTPRDYRQYLRVINASFAMRRKTFANNLKASFGLDQAHAAVLLESLGLDTRVRGEALTIKQLCQVSDALGEIAK